MIIFYAWSIFFFQKHFYLNSILLFTSDCFRSCRAILFFFIFLHDNVCYDGFLHGNNLAFNNGL